MLAGVAAYFAHTLMAVNPGVAPEGIVILPDTVAVPDADENTNSPASANEPL